MPDGFDVERAVRPPFGRLDSPVRGGPAGPSVPDSPLLRTGRGRGGVRADASDTPVSGRRFPVAEHAGRSNCCQTPVESNGDREALLSRIDERGEGRAGLRRRRSKATGHGRGPLPGLPGWPNLTTRSVDQYSHGETRAHRPFDPSTDADFIVSNRDGLEAGLWPIAPVDPWVRAPNTGSVETAPVGEGHSSEATGKRAER